MDLGIGWDISSREGVVGNIQNEKGKDWSNSFKVFWFERYGSDSKEMIIRKVKKWFNFGL